MRKMLVALLTSIFTLQGTYEKGSNDDIEEFIYRLLDVNSDGIVGRYITITSYV